MVVLLNTSIFLDVTVTTDGCVTKHFTFLDVTVTTDGCVTKHFTFLDVTVNTDGCVTKHFTFLDVTVTADGCVTKHSTFLPTRICYFLLSSIIKLYPISEFAFHLVKETHITQSLGIQAHNWGVKGSNTIVNKMVIVLLDINKPTLSFA